MPSSLQRAALVAGTCERRDEHVLYRSEWRDGGWYAFGQQLTLRTQRRLQLPRTPALCARKNTYAPLEEPRALPSANAKPLTGNDLSQYWLCATLHRLRYVLRSIPCTCR